MGKDKGKGGVPNKHLHARIAYLERAATYLTHQAPSKSGLENSTFTQTSVTGSQQATADLNNGHNNKDNAKVADASDTIPPKVEAPTAAAPTILAAHLKSIARRSQIRLPASTKHQICKRCSALLVEGKTSTRLVENLSKRSQDFPDGKPWANVIVVECGVCGARKRSPVGAQRQAKKGARARAMSDDTNSLENPASAVVDVKMQRSV